MPQLYFKVGSDVDRVIQLREEITKLKTVLSGMDGNTSPATFRAMEVQLSKNTKELDNLIVTAARAGNEIDHNFKKKIYDASRVVNKFTEDIIQQKNVVKDVEVDVKRLGEAYRYATKNTPMSAAGKLSEYNAAKQVLMGEKAALFGLTQEQAKARLSVQNLRGEYALYKNDSIKVVSANEDIAGSLKHMVLTIAGADAIKNFISNIVDVAGNFQKMEAVLTNTLGSASKAKEAIDMLSDFGAKTPFQVDELTSSFVKLANQGFTPTMEQMRKLGDLASSTGKSFDQLTEAIIDAQVGENERLKEFGIRASKNGDLITYTFKEQETTVKNTASAIREYILSLGDLEGVVGANEKISATFVGRLSNIEDELTNQFKDFGEKFNTELSAGIGLTGDLVENLNNIIPVIAGLVTAYGSYRAAVLAVNAAHRAGALYESIRLMAMYRKEIGLATAAQKVFNTASKANIYATLISLLLGLGAAVYMFTKKTKDATDSQKRLSDTSKDLYAELSKETHMIDKLFGDLKKAKEGTKEYDDAKQKILDNYGQYLSGMNTEIATLKDQKGAYDAVTEAIKRNITEKMKEKFINEGVGDSSAKQAEALKALREKIYKDVGEDTGQALFESIKDTLSKNNPDDYLGIVRQLQQAGVKDDAFGYGKVITDAIVNFKNAEKDIKQVFKDAEDLFAPKEDKSKTIIYSDVTKEISEATSNITTLKQALADLRSGKTQAEAGKTVQSAIEEKTKELKAAEDALATLTGQTTKESDKRLSIQQELSRFILESELKLQASRTSAMEDGKAKRIALAEQETKDTIAAIQKEKEEYLQKAKEGKVKVDPTVLATFDNRETAAKAKETADIARIEKEYTEEYKQRTKALADVFMNEEQRKLSAIKDRYIQEKKWADQQLKTGGMTKDEHKAYTTNIDKAQQQETYRSLLDNLNDYKQKEKDLRDKWDTDIATAAEAKDAYLVANLMEGKQKALSALNGQMLQESDEWQQLFGNLDNLTVEQLEKLSNTIKKKAKDLDLKPIDMKAVTDNLKEVDELIRSKNPFGSLSKHLKEYKTVEDETTKKNALKEMFRDTAASIDMVKGGFDAVISGLNDMGLAGDEATQQLLGDISNLMGAASQLATSIASANPVGIIQGSIGVLTSVFNIFNNDKRHEKKIERMQEQIDVLDKSYEKLGDEIEKVFSKDASNLIDQQNKLLEQQKVLIQQQINEENDKKKTDKDRIKDWQNQIDDINNAIADNKEKAVDAIFGEDMKSAIDNFASAYAEAWASGEDRTKSAKDTVKNMMRQMVTESIKAAMQSSGAMEKIRDKLKEFYSDNVLSGWEQDYIYNMAEELQKDLDRQFGWADSLMKDEQKPNEEEVSDNSLKGAYAKASQESIDLLAGQTGAVRVILEDVRGSIQPIREQMQLIYNLQREGWQDVKAIRDLTDKVEKNTERIADIAEKLDDSITEIGRDTRRSADALDGGTINAKIKM